MQAKKLLKKFLQPVKDILLCRAESIKVNKTEKTVHIVRTDAIGDFVLFSAILPYFEKIYPDYKIVLIVDDIVQELAAWIKENRVLGQGKYFNELVAINGKKYNRNPFYFYKILKKIRLSAPEVVLHPIFDRTEKGDNLALISKEAKKIGYEGDSPNIKISAKKNNDLKYDYLIKNPKSNLETERNRHFLNEVAGCEILKSSLPAWELNKSALNEGRDFLKANRIDILKPIVAICPGAGSKMRQWPVEKFVELLSLLHKYNSSLQFVIVGGKADKKVCHRIEEALSSGSLKISNFCAKDKLSLRAEILSFCKLYIGSETGSMHIACAVGAPVVALLGGGHYGRFFPYPAQKSGSQNIAVINKMNCFGCSWNCKYKISKNSPAPCVEKIEVQDVFNECIKIL